MSAPDRILRRPEKPVEVSYLSIANDLRQVADRLATAALEFAAVSTTRSSDDLDPFKIAADVYRARRRRDAEFGDLFGEPAWDILLDLFTAWRKQRQVYISSACIAAAVPATTGLRHLAKLEAGGLIVRYQDPDDGRRMFVELAPGVATRIARILLSYAA